VKIFKWVLRATLFILAWPFILANYLHGKIRTNSAPPVDTDLSDYYHHYVTTLIEYKNPPINAPPNKSNFDADSFHRNLMN